MGLYHANTYPRVRSHLCDTWWLVVAMLLAKAGGGWDEAGMKLGGLAFVYDPNFKFVQSHSSFQTFAKDWKYGRESQSHVAWYYRF